MPLFFARNYKENICIFMRVARHAARQSGVHNLHLNPKTSRRYREKFNPSYTCAAPRTIARAVLLGDAMIFTTRPEITGALNILLLLWQHRTLGKL